MDSTDVYGDEWFGPKTFRMLALILSNLPAMAEVMMMFIPIERDQYAVPILMVVGPKKPSSGFIVKVNIANERPEQLSVAAG